MAGRLPPPQRTEGTPDRGAPLPVAENQMLQMLIEHSAQMENMQRMMQNMMKDMVSQRTPPALLLPSHPPAPLPAPAASFPRLPPPLLPAGRLVAQTSCDPWAPPDQPTDRSASSGGAVTPGLRAAAAPPGPVEGPPPHSPPPPSQDGRLMVHISGSSWVAQDLPRQADICQQCERQEPHIC